MPRSRVFLWTLGVAAVCTTGALYFLLPWGNNTAHQADRTRTGDTSLRREEVDVSKRKPAPASAAPPPRSLREVGPASLDRTLLPPPDTPVKTVVEQLKKDADASVPTAACRMGMELARCRQAMISTSIRNRELSMIQGLPPQSDEAIRRRAAADEMLKGYAKDVELCEGITPEMTDSSWVYLLRSAQAGNIAAMTQFAVSPPLPDDNIVGNVEGWAAYRDFAPQFLRRAIEAGDVRALYSAFFQSAIGLGPGGSVLEKDPYRALVYASALMPLVDPDAQRMIQNALPQLQAQAGAVAPRAAQEGVELRQRFFGRTAKTAVSSGLGIPQPAKCLD